MNNKKIEIKDNKELKNLIVRTDKTMYDFLFVYEVKNRELENICLLKVELENRGYTVKLVETWYKELFYSEKIDARVVVVFALYNDSQISFVSKFTNQIKKIVNLQWEQVFSVADEENFNTLYNIKDSAKKAIHIAWGDFNHNRLVKHNGVANDNVPICGQVALDFYKPLLKGYYLSKNELCSKYSLDSNKKIHLFISSFSWCELPDSDLKQEVYQELAYNPFEFKRVSRESQRIVLDWYEKAASTFENIEFIYRPHPAEIENERLKQLQIKYNNFHVINQESIKQWIIISDDIATWYSTSIAEIYTANKTCAVLRPIEIPMQMDIRYYLNCDSIRSFDEFDKFVSGLSEKIFPIKDEILLEYYQIDQHGYSFKSISDVLEDVYGNDKYSYDYELVYTKQNSIKRLILNHLPKFISEMRQKAIFVYYRFLIKLAHKNILDVNNKKIEHLLYTEKMINNNYSTDEEINEICNKLRIILEKNGN